MVVHDLDADRSLGGPEEADPVLIVDPDAMLPRPVARQGLKAIAGGHPEVLQPVRRVELFKLPRCDVPDLPRTTPPGGLGSSPVEDILGPSTPEGSDHGRTIARLP